MPLSQLVQNVPVFRAEDFRVSVGANLGDGISVMDELMLDDVYNLTAGASRERLGLLTLSENELQVSDESATGHPGAALHLDCTVALMSPDGQTAEALVLVELTPNNTIANTYLLPLATLHPKTDYALVGFERSSARRKFAQVACVSFTRGTHITMATGAQTPIENIKVGARVLTRDHGPQTVRWIGHNTVRASGAYAPIVITAGALNNTNDLIVSPDHRLFIYQRSDQIGAGQPKVLIKARHLVNDDTVYVQDGGYVDYYQILFDSHHIIYAEGIAAESTLVDLRTRPALPAELLEKLTEILPGHESPDTLGLDVQKSLLDRPDVIDLLRLASMR